MQQQALEKGLAREDFSRFLSACYYQPSPEFSEEGIFGSLERAASFIGPEIVEKASRLGAEFAGSSHEDLLLDYSRLFLGPFHILAKPYGSVWLEGEKVIMGDSTMAVLDLYKEGGFELDNNFCEVPDHIAAELEFLYLLLFKHNEANRSGDPDGAKAAEDLKERFLTNHLGRWIAPFTEAVRANAQTDFYRLLAEITEIFVFSEKEKGQR